jgi:hypothetical protein
VAALAESIVATDPYVELRELLASYRRMGLGFDEAWALARSRIGRRLPTGRYHGQRGEFYAATGGTKDEWRKAYERVGLRLSCVEALRNALPDETETHPLRLVAGDASV